MKKSTKNTGINFFRKIYRFLIKLLNKYKGFSKSSGYSQELTPYHVFFDTEGDLPEPGSVSFQVVFSFWITIGATLWSILFASLKLVSNSTRSEFYLTVFGSTKTKELKSRSLGVKEEKLAKVLLKKKEKEHLFDQAWADAIEAEAKALNNKDFELANRLHKEFRRDFIRLIVKQRWTQVLKVMFKLFALEF